MRVVRGVEAEQAKIASEPAEMRIRSEPRLAEWLGTYARNRSDVERFEHRVDRDPIAIADAIREIDRLGVDDHEIHFGMWNACRLDHVLHGDFPIEAAHHCNEAVMPWQEIVQFGVEAELSTLGRPSAVSNFVRSKVESLR